MIKKGFDVNVRDRENKTPLHSACRFGARLEVLQALFSDVAVTNDLNATDTKNRNPLHLACLQGKVPDVVQLLIEKKSDINARGEEKKSPLIYASQNGAIPEVVKQLLENKADTQAMDKARRTALHYAVQHGDPQADVIVLLLEFQCDVNAQDAERKTALHVAVDVVIKTRKQHAGYAGVAKIVQSLMDYKADINMEDLSGAKAFPLEKTEWSAETDESGRYAFVHTSGTRLNEVPFGDYQGHHGVLNKWEQLTELRRLEE